MNHVQSLFIELLKRSVFGAETTADISISSDDIISLIDLSNQHFCQVIIANELKNYCQDAKLSHHFTELTKEVVLRNYASIMVQSEIVSRFKNAGINCAILKGTSVAQYYKEPLLRMFGDIDILVPENKYNDAIDMLLNGASKNAVSEKHKFHYALNYKGVPVEIHKYVTEYDNEKDCLQNILKPVFENIKSAKIDICEFPMLDTKYQAIAVLLHLKRHMTENNINMRMLLDWIVFANNISEKEWKADVYPLFEKLNIHLLSDTLFVLSDKYFGTENKAKIHFEKREFVADLLLEEFMSSGGKDTASRLSGNVGALYANSDKGSRIMKSISVLNELAERNYSFSKYKILLPVCWICIAVRYVYRVITHKRPKLSVGEIRKRISNKDKLYDILKIKDI